MIWQSLKGKIIFPLVIILFLLVSIITAYSAFVFISYSSLLKNEIISVNVKNLESYLERFENSTKTAAVSAAMLSDAVTAIKNRDTKEIIEILNPLADLFDINYFTVTDENGIALARTYEPERFGSPVANLKNFEDALNGIVSTYYESGSIIQLAIHTGSPVYDNDGKLIGVISAGIRLDQDEFVDRLKDHFSAEFSVFLGNKRIATTIKINGLRIDENQEAFDSKAAAVYSENKINNYYDISADSFIAFGYPVYNSKDELAAMIITGISNAGIINERNRMIINNSIIGIAGLIISLVILMPIITRNTRPLKKLATLVSDVTHSNLNVNIDRKNKNEDEIAALTSDVFSLIEQLRESVYKAQAASVAKSTFLANMSHEIRSPMNSIMGFSELALDDNIPLRTKEYLGKILENTEGLLQIINDILDISKVESGKMELEKIPFSLGGLLESCRTLIMPKAVEKGISLRFHVEPSLEKMPLGDPTRMRQVLVNLLSNAVKFTYVGTVSLYCSIKDISIKTVTVYFEVKDTGIGMTSEQIEKISFPFTQADTGITRQFGGTGLGIPITKNILNLMGGNLLVESTPGLGSKFSFYITFDTIEVSEDDRYRKKIPLNELKKPQFEGEVLICEDNPMNQQVICEHLSRVGLKTVVAWNGRIGVDFVKERILSGSKQFDLVFMDIHMPVMDGIQAANRIRDLDGGIPVVAMTANVMADDKENYLRNGMKSCVGKPFTSQELWHCLMRYFTPINKEESRSVQDEKAGPMDSDIEFLKSLKSLFVRENQNKFNEITKALEQDDVELAYRLAHTLKSNAGQIGKTSLQKAAADIESILKNGNNLVTEDLLKNLNNEMTIVLDEFSPLLLETDVRIDSMQTEIEPEKALELLDKLISLLQSGNPECLNYISDVCTIPGNNDLKLQLIQQMDDFKFEPALLTCNELREKLNA